MADVGPVLALLVAQREEDARRTCPELMKIVEEKVRPLRRRQKNKGWAKYWWRFAGSAAELRQFMRGLDRVLVNCQVTAQFAFAFQPTDRIFSHGLNIFSFSGCPEFAVMQSRIHESWARTFASSLEDRLRYGPADCFETFPFPEGVTNNATLEIIGHEYFEFRAALMVRNNEGLTKTYNRFHDLEEKSHDTLKLRELHAAMDRAVLEAYGMTEASHQMSSNPHPPHARKPAHR
jgi:acyl-CoA synthetase (AMP-forming)/AMP-acid ligase II